MTQRWSVAMTEAVHEAAVAHLDREDHQEDICLFTYRPSTGARRSTALLSRLVLPGSGDRIVHGVATITGEYVLRAAALAAKEGMGLAIAHSHPGACSWQGMSPPDVDTEQSYAPLAREITGYPLVGLTLGTGNHSWSARFWDASTSRSRDCENVRVVGQRLQVSWHPGLRPPAQANERTRRTVHCWGLQTHQDLARLRVLVVGAGSVGMDVALRLAQSGFLNVAVMDFDNVDESNLDRLVGATTADARTARPKLAVAARLLGTHSTADLPESEFLDESICQETGLQLALDYDLIFSCVDRPWPRAVLNSIAYADLIPVIDGGVAVDTFEDGTMRNAVWRSHVIRPGRPCLVCNGQVDPAEVTRDRQGLLDDPSYLAGVGQSRVQPSAANVAMISISAAASLLTQFISYTVAPSGMGDPGPLRFSLNTHTVEHLPLVSRDGCFVEDDQGLGDGRIGLTGPHAAVDVARAARQRGLDRASCDSRRRPHQLILDAIRRRMRS